MILAAQSAPKAKVQYGPDDQIIRLPNNDNILIGTYLLHAKANPHLKDKQGLTAAHYPYYREIVQQYEVDKAREQQKKARGGEQKERQEQQCPLPAASGGPIG